VRVDDRVGGADVGRPEPDAVTDRAGRRLSPWSKSLVYGGAAFVISRLMVLGAAGVVAAAKQPRPTSAARPILEVLTSWDGLWYMEVVRRGYPTEVPDPVTFFHLEARTAFFPLYPALVRWADAVLPGRDTFAALAVNALFGLLFVLAVGLLTRDIWGDRAAGRAMVLTALFPGSFVLSFAYSEPTMLALAAFCLLALQRRWWLTAGVLAALATAARPNAVALVAAAAVASFLAIRRERDWRSLWAPLLAPIGFIGYMLFLWHQTGEKTVWFRVQQQAWNEGASFGWTAIRDIFDFVTHPFDSAVNVITSLSVIAVIVMLVALWKARPPAPVVAYTLVVVGLMLLPATVTARPRFLLTAFPLVIAVAVLWPDEDREWWGMLLALCGAGLTGVVVTYGLLAAIP
jgi:Gpi18-like mannosyltransferase